MFNFLDPVVCGTLWIINVTGWLFATGWKIWGSLFSAIPYGDPYIAIVAALLLCYLTVKTIYPSHQTY